MRIRVLLAGLSLVASATSAFAAGPYIGVAGGVSILHDGDIEVAGIGTAEAEYDTGHGFNVTAGYNVDPVRIEFEFGYKSADMDKLSGPGGSASLTDTEFTVKSYMVNALYDFKGSSQATPYIGVGLGLLNGELEVQGSEADENEIGYQAIVGTAFNLDKNVAIDLSYRLHSAPSDFSKDGVEIEYMSSNIMLGIRYNF